MKEIIIFKILQIRDSVRIHGRHIYRCILAIAERQFTAGPGKIIIIFCQIQPVILKTGRPAGYPVQADRQTVSF